MKKRIWPAYAAWILGTEAVGTLSGWLTRQGAERYALSIVKPPLSPPGPVFPAVWAALFALMGAGAARVWLAPASPARGRALAAFGAQLAFNFCWSLIFFNAGGLWGRPALAGRPVGADPMDDPGLPPGGPGCRPDAAALSAVGELRGLSEFRRVGAELTAGARQGRAPQIISGIFSLTSPLKYCIILFAFDRRPDVERCPSG